MREHNEAVNALDVIDAAREITVDYAPGTVERGDAARRLGAAPAQARRELRSDRPRRGASPICRSARRPARSSPAFSTSTRSAGDLNDRMNTVETPLNALRDNRALPRRQRRSTRSTPACGSHPSIVIPGLTAGLARGWRGARRYEARSCMELRPRRSSRRPTSGVGRGGGLTCWCAPIGRGHGSSVLASDALRGVDRVLAALSSHRPRTRWRGVAGAR